MSKAGFSSRVPVTSAPSGVASNARVTVPVWLNWASIAAMVLGASVLSRLIDPSPGTNLAITAHVSASSRDGTFESSKGAADGNIWNVGFRTELEARPWLMLDLGAEKRLTRVVVYNCYDRYPYPAVRPAFDPSLDARVAQMRFDCRQENQIPLAVETSRDGVSFHEIARQNQRFELWTVKVNGQTARFVRVRLLREGNLQLREVEVY